MHGPVNGKQLALRNKITWFYYLICFPFNIYLLHLKQRRCLKEIKLQPYSFRKLLSKGGKCIASRSCHSTIRGKTKTKNIVPLKYIKILPLSAQLVKISALSLAVKSLMGLIKTHKRKPECLKKLGWILSTRTQSLSNSAGKTKQRTLVANEYR